ncbi:hypothetical protein HZA96_02320 [Candidatus Woesearchaeota archaeon]|nr:hypothetical protein [Candidatus Woesearchaeota archaeon]
MTLEEEIQTLETGAKILELRSELHHNLSAVFVGTIASKVNGKHDLDSLNYGKYDSRRDDHIPVHIKEALSLYKALVQTKMRMSSIPLEKFSLDPKRYKARLESADIVIAPKINMDSVKYGNIVVLVDEIDLSYTKHPQLVKGSLPKDDSLSFLHSAVLDHESYNALYGGDTEKTFGYFFTMEKPTPRLLNALFSGYDLDKPQLADWVLNPLTDRNLIAQRTDAINYFMVNDDLLKSLTKNDCISLDSTMKALLWSVMDLFQCYKGKAGIGFMNKHSKHGHRMGNIQSRDGGTYLFDPEEAKDVAQFCYEQFMKNVKNVVQNLESISFPDLTDADVPQLGRIQRAVDHIMKNEEKGISSLKKKLQEIIAADPKDAKELYHLFGERNSLEKFRYITTSFKKIEKEIALYAGLAKFFKEKKRVRSTIVPKEERIINIENGLNPFLHVSKPMPNSVYLNHDTLVEIVEGPNEAGKSIYADMAAILVNFAQAGLYVPASSATISIHERIFVRHRQVGTNIKSSFAAEKQAIKELYEQITGCESYCLVVLDE